MGDLIDEGTSWGRYAKASGHMDGVTKDENGQLWKNGHLFSPEHGGELPVDDQICEKQYPNRSHGFSMNEGRTELPRDLYHRSEGPQLVSEESIAADEAALRRVAAKGLIGVGEPGFFAGESAGKAPCVAQNLMNALDAEFPKNVPAQGEVWDIDLTVAELLNMAACDNLHLYAVLQFLKANWVGGNPAREHDVRAGTMYCYVDDDGHLRMDFRSRFTVNKGLMPQLQGMIAKAGELAPEVVRMAGNVCKELNDKIEAQTGCCGFGDHTPEAVADRAKRMAEMVGMTAEADRAEQVWGEGNTCRPHHGQLGDL